MSNSNDMIEVTDEAEIAAIGAPGLAGWINGCWQDGKWWAYRYSLERWRAQRVPSVGPVYPEVQP